MGKYGMRGIKTVGGGGITPPQIQENEPLIKAIRPDNVGWLEAKLPQEAMERLWQYIENANEIHNQNLAGNLSKSLKLEDIDDWFYKNFLLRLCEIHITEFGEAIVDDVPVHNDETFWQNHHPILNDIWCNFQYQNEFNPIHKHNSCIWSFVVWMKIPTNYVEQHQLDFVKNSTTPSASNFIFNYSGILGNSLQHQYKLDQTYEGTILFFPGKLQHQVYPFYNCDEARISISGNIGLGKK